MADGIRRHVHDVRPTWLHHLSPSASPCMAIWDLIVHAGYQCLQICRSARFWALTDCSRNTTRRTRKLNPPVRLVGSIWWEASERQAADGSDAHVGAEEGRDGQPGGEKHRRKLRILTGNFRKAVPGLGLGTVRGGGFLVRPGVLRCLCVWDIPSVMRLAQGKRTGQCKSP
jgi:hypothetical protein